MHEAVRRGGVVRPLTGPRPSRALPLLLLATLLAPGCGGGSDPLHRTLLREVETDDTDAPVCAGAEAEAPAAEPRGVVRGNSRREAVVTCEGVALRVHLDPAIPSAVELSLTVAGAPTEDGPPPEGATATLTLDRNGDRGGEPEILLEVPVEPGEWSDHRVDLPDRLGRGGATLVLRSSGAGPVAWAGLHLNPREPAAAAERPSLILVSLDTVRADHLSLYGYPRPTTPRLERLGAESLVFTRALSSSTWTLPSTATLLTGLFPSQHRTLRPSHQLAPGVATVAERLRDAGYRTAALTDGGFAGFPFGLGQGFDRYDVTPGKAWQPRAKDAAQTFAAAADWVLRNQHRPFFLFLHTYEAHQPYLNREGFADPFLAPEDRGLETSGMIDPHHPERTPAELARLIALYDGEIARADHYLGGFLDALADAGVADQVAVIVTSDHGEEFLEHGDLEHAFGKVFDPNVHVPLVVKPPAGRAVAGRRLDTPVSGIDVAPTLLDLAGLPHDDLPGRSLLASEAARRPVLVHGLPSFPSVTAERFRLDGAGPTAILDRPSRRAETELLRYDPGTEAVEPWRRSTGEDSPVPRLAAFLAWAEEGSLFARLPDDAGWIAVPAGSRVRPRAVWTGRDWIRVKPDEADAFDPGGAGIELRGEGPHFVVFDLTQGPGPWAQPWGLSLARAREPGLQPYRLTAERRPPWNPLADPLPPPGAVLPTATLSEATTAELDEDTAKELRALGYLQ